MNCFFRNRLFQLTGIIYWIIYTIMQWRTCKEYNVYKILFLKQGCETWKFSMSKSYKVNKLVFLSSPFFINHEKPYILFHPFIQVFGSQMRRSAAHQFFGQTPNCFLSSVTVGGTGALHELVKTSITVASILAHFESEWMSGVRKWVLMK